MRIVSWNVNGLRACIKKGYLDVLERTDADVWLLQEVRAFPAQLPAAAREPDGWHTAFFPAERPGYSGVAIYSRQAPDKVETSLGEDRFDTEGRPSAGTGISEEHPITRLNHATTVPTIKPST